MRGLVVLLGLLVASVPGGKAWATGGAEGYGPTRAVPARLGTAGQASTHAARDDAPPKPAAAKPTGTKPASAKPSSGGRIARGAGVSLTFVLLVILTVVFV
jgi:hypothetical protein